MGAETAERERIATQRAAVETRFAEERVRCQQNFVVTACVDDARHRQRGALAGLRRQEAALDETQRRQRATERAAAIRAKVSAEHARRLEPGAASQAPLRMTAPRAGPVARAAAAPGGEAAPGMNDAQREAHEARSRARFEAHQREVRAHREAAEQRAAQRAQKGKQAAPLPPAGPASAP